VQVTAPLVPNPLVARVRVLLPSNQQLDRNCPNAQPARVGDVPPVLQSVHGMPEVGSLTGKAAFLVVSRTRDPELCHARLECRGLEAEPFGGPSGPANPPGGTFKDPADVLLLDVDQS
jgi:hypothetical protein